jgi:hypothetical protein
MDNTYYRLWATGSPDYDPSEDMDKLDANQGWYRSPEDAGGLIYNDLYGWQLADDVRQKYRDYGQTPTNDYFSSANWFTPQTGQDWSQYYPDRHPDSYYVNQGLTWDGSQWVSGGGSGGSGGSGAIGGTSGTTGATGTSGGGTVTDYNTGAFTNYPSQWLQSSDVLSNLAQTGQRTQDPSQWYDATNVANQMAYNGMPTDTSASYQAQLAQSKQDIADAIRQSNEQSGVNGLRWSSVNNRNAQDIAGRAMTSLAATTTQQSMAAEEAARARQQQAVTQLQSLGTSSSGLTEAATNRQQSASNDLSSLGSLFAQYPLQVANQAYTEGQGLQSSEQSQIDATKTEAFRQFAENNPWLQYVMNLSSTSGTPTQYQSGCMG